MAPDAQLEHQFVYGEVNFLARKPLYDLEKPYSMRYPPQGDLKQSNLRTEKRSIKMNNVRSLLPKLNFDRCGFNIMRMQSQMKYEDFDDEWKIASIYAQEISQALEERLNAHHVYVMDYAVRKRHPSFPTSTGENYKDEQPTSIVHMDFTTEEAERMLRILYGSRANEILEARWQVINVWRSIRGTVRDWPLTVCDAETLDPADVVPADIVYPDWVTENMQVHYNNGQQWYYLPEQEADDCWIFKSADSAMKTGGQCPHSSFADPNTMPDDEPRQIIDCRVFVLYADLEPYPPEVGRLYGEKPQKLKAM